MVNESEPLAAVGPLSDDRPVNCWARQLPLAVAVTSVLAVGSVLTWRWRKT
jgi:hypothetical protein